jgi:hypothetical protein
MNSIAVYILDALIAIIVGVFVKIGIPYIKSLITEKNLAFVTEWVDRLVDAAEQKIQGTKLGDERKAYVISILEKIGVEVDETIDALIEAAVKNANLIADTAAVVAETAANTIIEGTTETTTASEVADLAVDAITDAIADATAT